MHHSDMNHARRLPTLALVGVVSMLVTISTRGAAWFVDNTAAGTGSGNSWANAFVHLSQLFAANVLPGDAVYFSGGPSGSSQTYGGYLRIKNNGTSSNPITITRGTDASHNGVVIFDGGDGAETFSYVEMTGRQYITIDGSVGGDTQGFGFNNLFNTSDRTMANKIFADNSIGLVIRYCGFTNVNNAFRGAPCTQFYIGNCNFKDIRGDAAIRAVGCGPDIFDSNIMEFNSIHLAFCTNCAANVYGPDGVQGSYGMTFRYNFVTCDPVAFTTSTQHPDFLQWTGNHNKAYGNLFLNPGDSCIDLDCFANATPSNWWIYNNIFQIATTCGVPLGATSPNPWFFRTYSSAGPVTSYTNMKFWNNLFLDNSGWNSIAWTWAGTPTLSGIEMKNNLFQNSPPYFVSGSNPNFSPAKFGLATNVYATGGSWLIQGASWSTNTWGPNEPSAIFSVPSYVGYTPTCVTSDMHPSPSDTIATGRGANLSASFTTDYSGATRTVPWDIGAYKASGSGILPPNAPTNIAPANGATGVALAPTLTVTAYSDPNTPASPQSASQFQVLASDGVTVVWDSGDISPTASTSVTTALSPSTPYKWRARFKNQFVYSAYSGLTGFTTLAASLQPPNTPSNVSPPNNATGTALNPTLQGSSYSDPNHPTSSQLDAQFFVYGADHTTLLFNSGTGLGAVNSWTTPVLQSGQTYYWTWRVQNAAGLWSGTSAPTGFVTAPTNTSRVTIRAIVTKTGQIIFP